MDWNTGDRTQDRTRIEAGTHRVRIAKVMRESKKKGFFVTSKGDAQAMLILNTANGAEAGSMVTLSKKAAYFFHQIIEAVYPPEEINKLKAAPVEVVDFANENLLHALLVGTEAIVDIDYDDRNYSTITWHKWTDRLPKSSISSLVLNYTPPAKGATLDPVSGQVIPF